MKALYITLLSCFFSIAQNPELFTNNWYLEKVIFDSIEYFPPSTVNEDFPTLEYSRGIKFFPSSMVGFNSSTVFSLCSENYLGFDSVISNSVITLTFYINISPLCPLDNEQLNYQNYIPNFLTNNSTVSYVNNPITINYDINTVNNYKQLILTNSQGNKLVYNSINLSTSSPITAKKANLYPNPVSSILTLENATAFSKGYVYSLDGKLIQEVTFINNAIDVSSFSKGIYLLKLEDDNGGIVVEKFLRE